MVFTKERKMKNEKKINSQDVEKIFIKICKKNGIIIPNETKKAIKREFYYTLGEYLLEGFKIKMPLVGCFFMEKRKQKKVTLPLVKKGKSCGERRLHYKMTSRKWETSFREAVEKYR